MRAIDSISAIPIEMPLRETFETSQRRADLSPTVLIKLAASGIIGWGEATPIKYVTGEDQDSVINAVKHAHEVLIGRPVESYRNCSSKLANVIPESHTARAGIETAILDAASKAAGLPLCVYLGGRPITVETDITIPLVDPKLASSLALHAAKHGFSKYKVKVGGHDIDQDIERVLAVDRVTTDATFILDANGGFEPDTAISFIKDLIARDIAIDIFEQPVPRNDLNALKRVNDLSPVPVYADESAVSVQDVLKLIKLEAISGIVIKLMKSGCLGALTNAYIANAAGLGLMMGTMLESCVGQAASLHIAAAVGSFTHFDLDSDMLLMDETAHGGFNRTDSIISLIEQPGLGVQVNL